MSTAFASTPAGADPSDRAAVFERLRPRLFGIAYRMLGTVPDAEDVLQTAYLRWHEAGGSDVQNPEAWLVSVTSRLAVDRLRQASGERKRYVGDWLPEPLLTGAAPPADARSELASDLSMAFLVLLERLSPDERAALLLRDVFGAGYGEIARVLDRSEEACRQVLHRARLRVREGRPRFEVPLEARHQLVARLLDRLAAADEQALLALVSDDATWTSDGGGKVHVARGLRGSARIVRFLLNVARKAGGRMRRELVWINGEPAMLTYLDGRPFSTTSIATDGGRVTAFYAVLNPDKLRRVEQRRDA
ncbi:RNA polymerase sigma factor SigJ [Anaeromyxobacter sp. PSR-1]|uniref:RNA polymerase sigma factor SigJ n=1 Tax=Anaeromyxobacter sp. PSR-1 TaxID=1300915 RepID=UPI0005E179A6|nr:RNA polymerase sigma factor SigJ [Anaeromyxobacter sp. PSR-1]GAO02036.1 ECF RNA polymerase sigma factor SigJ [Anaeromyxobacter sp. PSR-1]